MRLIDADAIPYTIMYKENWLKGTGIEKQGTWKDDIDALPTVDAVPIEFIRSEIKNTQGAYPYSLRILLDAWAERKDND